MYRPFAKWRDLRAKETSKLWQTPFSNLVGRASYDKQLLECKARDLESNVQALASFKHQISEVLMPRHEGSKKLALSLLKQKSEIKKH